MIEQDFKLIEELNEFNLQSLMGLSINEYQKFEKFSVVYSNSLKDEYWNFITNIKISNEQEFHQVIKNGETILKNNNRKVTVAVMPFMKNLYENKEQYFENNYILSSYEAWQIYNEFDKVDEIKTNCEYDVILEKTENMKLFSDELIKMFKTENEKDPYGELDDSYREAYANYKNATEGIYNEFYLIKVNNEIAGVTGGAFNNDYYGIHSVAIKEEYRGKGIGKETIKQQLKIAKEKKVKLAVLQTEEGYYPAEFYRKIGFKDLCHCYYYTKNEQNNKIM